MEKSLSAIIADNLPDKTATQGEPSFEIFNSTHMDILITRDSLEICSNEHCHDYYEFFIPFSFSPHLKSLKIDEAVIIPKPGTLIPCNPGQSHGADGSFTIYNSLCIYVQKDFILRVAYTTSGAKDVFFHNETNPYNHNLQRLVNIFIQEARAQQAGYKYILESISAQIVVDLLRNLKSNINEKMQRTESGARVNILRAIEYLTENYNQKLTNKEIFEIANLSPYYFIRLFKKETGKTPHEYLLHLKIEKAKELLAFSNYSVTEICFICGFSEHSHFSKVFKKLSGSTPLQYRKENKRTHARSNSEQ